MWPNNRNIADWYRAASVVVLATICLTAVVARADAYRPFVSTDAAVANPREIEVELGYFTLRRQSALTTFFVPTVVLNYGLWRDLELVGEFRAALPAGGDVELVDPGLFIKAVLREGLLQEREGISVAVEAGPLLPSSVRGDRGVGFEAIAIASTRLEPFIVHVNLGGGVDRHDARAFGLWGVIAELPVDSKVRIVAEVAGERVGGERANDSALLGVIWRPAARGMFVGPGGAPRTDAWRPRLGNHHRGDIRI